MKRWMISALSTLLLLLASIGVSFFIPCNNTLQGNTPCHDTVITVKNTVIKKKSVKKSEEVKKDEKPLPEKKETDNLKPDNKKQDEALEQITEDTADEINDETASSETDESTDYAEYGEENTKEEEEYRQYVLKRIASKKVYPVSARTKSQEGRVRLHIIVDSSGRLVLSEISLSSEYEVLDEAALKAVKKAEPFKKMKDGRRNLDLKFAMDFSLK